ncbi:MAG: MBL fold metallo-hydrolase [Clostridia bacterium]|nr:MBL fold metallo-hydrolase [Clostridia bacterium]
MLIYHHAHSEFLIETAQGFRILTDPFDAHVGYPMRDVPCDAVTVSHGHGDHSYIDKAKCAQVIADRAGKITLATGITATGIPCFHDDQQGALRGNNLIFIIEVDGLRLAHFGDLGAWDEDLARQLAHIDIALVPVGGYYTMDAAAAAALMKRIQPRMVIPMHYKTDANRDWPIAPLDECLKAFGLSDIPRMPLLRVTKEDLSEQPRMVILEESV